MKKKIILIQGLLAPYRYPIFAELAKRSDWDFEVWFMGKSVKNRIWGEEGIKSYNFNYKFLSGTTLNFGTADNYPFWVNMKVYSLLSEKRPDAVIMMGWDSLTSFLAHIACRALGIKFVLYSDSTAMEKSWRRSATGPLVRLHVNSADALISGGTRSRIYLENLGARSENIYVSYNTVDVEKYGRYTAKFKKVASETRTILRLGNKKVILYYAQLIKRKGGDILLSAFKSLKEKYPDIALILVGSGKYRETLQGLIDEGNIKDAMILDDPGDEDICRYYSIADVFVLPSREDVWGLVVNEAMAASLPVVVSDVAGSAADLVRQGYNGYTFKNGNIEDLETKIEKIISNKKLRKEMSANSFALIRSFSPKLTVEKFSEAVEGLFTDKSVEINFENREIRGMLSIIIPFYKDKSDLQKTIESLDFQKSDKYKFEIILGEDKWGNSSYKARNEAIKKSKGEFIAFIDTGSTPGIGWIEKGTRDLVQYDYVGGPVEVVKDNTDKIPDWVYRFERNREFPVREFMDDLRFSPTTNLFVRRSLIEKIGGFDGSLSSSGDYEFGDRVYRSKEFSQYFDPGLKVLHQARSLNSLLEKQKRLAKGFVDLGKIYPERFSSMKFNLIKSLLKTIYPPIWLFGKKSWNLLPLGEKFEVFFSTYFFSFIQHFQAIRYGLLHGL